MGVEIEYVEMTEVDWYSMYAMNDAGIFNSCRVIPLSVRIHYV